MGNEVSKCKRRHTQEACGGFGEFLKSQWVELSPASGEDGWLSLARRSQASCLYGRCRSRFVGRWRSQNRKNVYLSPYFEETLNSKVIKSPTWNLGVLAKIITDLEPCYRKKGLSKDTRTESSNRYKTWHSKITEENCMKNRLRIYVGKLTIGCKGNNNFGVKYERLNK